MAAATATQPKSKDKKEKKEKPEVVLTRFHKAAPADILSPEGLITVDNPEKYGYDEEKHEALAKEDFASEANWNRFRARQLRARAASLIEKAERLERDAELGAAGSGETKTKLRRMGKLVDAMADLRAQLAKEGIDVDALLAAKAAKATPAT